MELKYMPDPELENYIEIKLLLDSRMDQPVQKALGLATLNQVHATVNLKHAIEATNKKIEEVNYNLADLGEAVNNFNKSSSKLTRMGWWFTGAIAMSAIIGLAIQFIR